MKVMGNVPIDISAVALHAAKPEFGAVDVKSRAMFYFFLVTNEMLADPPLLTPRQVAKLEG